ncbi:hypothetical protein [Vibrio atlanticus]|uniref:hypothetical protein n=1 Tax=Vibrio atlanticus TaxID=693153 RepID=UPI00059C9BE8|nr:hypothetical protein [Vibrio atlanticus]
MKEELKEKFIFESIIGTVPQWYETTRDSCRRRLTINNNTYYFGSHRGLTPALSELLDYCESRVEYWMEQLPKILSTSAKKNITNDIAAFWLNNINSKINWDKFICYADELLYRTYENNSISINLLISPQQNGSIDITENSLQKCLDPLASSMQTYIRVDS